MVFGFQSTHPVRGATFRRVVTEVARQFQSTHPVRGATRGGCSSILAVIRFQSTHPVRGATPYSPVI